MYMLFVAVCMFESSAVTLVPSSSWSGDEGFFRQATQVLFPDALGRSKVQDSGEDGRSCTPTFQVQPVVLLSFRLFRLFRVNLVVDRGSTKISKLGFDGRKCERLSAAKKGIGTMM